jgi:hypothetical protein
VDPASGIIMTLVIPHLSLCFSNQSDNCLDFAVTAKAGIFPKSIVIRRFFIKIYTLNKNMEYDISKYISDTSNQIQAIEAAITPLRLLIREQVRKAITMAKSRDICKTDAFKLAKRDISRRTLRKCIKEIRQQLIEYGAERPMISGVIDLDRIINEEYDFMWARIPKIPSDKKEK